MVAPFTNLRDGDAENLTYGISYMVLSQFITRPTLPAFLFYIYIYKHTHTHIYIYTHTHIFMLFSDSSLSSTQDKDDLFRTGDL